MCVVDEREGREVWKEVFESQNWKRPCQLGPWPWLFLKLSVSSSVKLGITGTTLTQWGRTNAWAALSEYSVNRMLPWLPLLLLCRALDWAPCIQLWDLMSSKHFLNTFSDRNIWMSSLCYHISFQILGFTKPLDLITIYLEMEICSHWYDWYYVLLTPGRLWWTQAHHFTGHHVFTECLLCARQEWVLGIQWRTRESPCPEGACTIF